MGLSWDQTAASDFDAREISTGPLLEARAREPNYLGSSSVIRFQTLPKNGPEIDVCSIWF